MRHYTQKKGRGTFGPGLYEEEIYSVARRDNVDATAAAIELHHATLKGKKREVAPKADIAPGQVFAPALADENVAGKHFLPAEFFDAEALANAVAPIFDAALSFFVSHEFKP